MLKGCLLPTNYGNKITQKCGEIVCSANTNFTIICVRCKIKLFDFEDFVHHYKNAHVDKIHHLKDEKWPESCEEQDFFKDDNVSIVSKNNLVENAQSVKYEESECESHIGGIDSGWPIEDENDESDGAEECVYMRSSIFKKPQEPKDFQCRQCSKRYTTAKNLRMHENLVHLRQKDYKCDQCAAKFSGERYLDAHKRKLHTEFPCTQCDKVYKTMQSLKYHECTHKETPDLFCEFENCGKAFKCKKNLTNHMRIHTQERNIVCEICGYRTRFRKNLEDHIRTHTGERPFICKTCGKGFATKSMMIEHQPIHSSDRPHKCDVCGAAFSRAKALYHHKHLHLAVKKFVCKICDKAYAQAAGLAGHMRHHKAEMNSLY